MNFAENYDRFSATYDGSGPHPLFLAQAALAYPRATDDELEILAQQYIPGDFALIVACEEIKAEQGSVS